MKCRFFVIGADCVINFCDSSFLSECRLTERLCLYVLRCCTTLNRFSQLIFIPHGLQNKIFPSVEKTCSPNSETNDRIRATNELFSFVIL